MCPDPAVPFPPGFSDSGSSDIVTGTDSDGASFTAPSEVPWDAYLSYSPSELVTNSVSTLENRLVSLSLTNPFEIHRDCRYKHARQTFAAPEDGYINGYIKFHLGSASVDGPDDPAPKRRCANDRTVLTEDNYREKLKKFGYCPLPRNFSPGLRLDSPDLLCWSFCAFCLFLALLLNFKLQIRYILTVNRPVSILPRTDTAYWHQFLV